MIKRGILIIPFVILSILYSDRVFAQQMEFNLGFAYDRPIDDPLPELSSGFGFNFSTCLWLKKKYGLSIGAMGTAHEYAAGSLGNQSFRFDAERDVIYFEGRYKFYRTRYWEFIGVAGYTFSNNIHGGDNTGGYVDYREEYDYYDNNDLGYEGSGFWLGMSAYRAIASIHRGYYMFITVRYMDVKYTKQQYYDIYTDPETLLEYLTTFERHTDLSTSSLVIHLGIVYRFDFDDF